MNELQIYLMYSFIGKFVNQAVVIAEIGVFLFYYSYLELCRCGYSCVDQNVVWLFQSVGVDKDSHLNLRQVPEDLLPALEQHLADMDASKKSSGSQPRCVCVCVCVCVRVYICWMIGMLVAVWRQVKKLVWINIRY